MSHPKRAHQGNHASSPKRIGDNGDRSLAKSSKLREHVFFIGFMGAGKSSVARRIARISKIASLDMDKYIVRSQGKSIPEIFDQGGETLFRSIETSVLKEIGDMEDPMFVSCGGGIVQTPENIELLKRYGTVVHLVVDADEAAHRISNLDSRPLFNDIESARALCDQRIPLYEEAADITIATKGKSVGKIASEVMDALSERGIMQQAHRRR